MYLSKLAIKNTLFSTTCAIALLANSSSILAMQREEAVDADTAAQRQSPRQPISEEDITRVRTIGERLGLAGVIASESEITPALRDSVFTTDHVHNFYVTIKAFVPSSFIRTTYQDWNTLAVEAREGKYSSLYKSILADFDKINDFANIHTSVLGRDIDSERPKSMTRQYTPLEMSELLDNFSAQIKAAQDANAQRMAIDGFTTQMLSVFPLNLEEGGDKGEQATGSSAVFPKNIDELRRFLEETIAYAQAIPPTTALLREIETKSRLDDQKAALSRNIAAIDLFRRFDNLRPHSYVIRDYMLATFLQEETGKGADQIEADKRTRLLEDSSFNTLNKATADQQPFSTMGDIIDITPDDQVKHSQRSLKESIEALREEAQSLLNSIKAAQDRSAELGREFNNAIENASRLYKELKWAKASTLGATA